jgi:hypothetical protein
MKSSAASSSVVETCMRRSVIDIGSVPAPIHRRFATKEIARLLEAPLGTILARLHRGRRLFEREMWANAQEAGLLTTAR